MTIDERLEKLTERHEALAQTVEIIVGMQRVNEEMFHAVTADLTGRMATLTDTMNRLANIVISHEERIDDLEHGRN